MFEHTNTKPEHLTSTRILWRSLRTCWHLHTCTLKINVTKLGKTLGFSSNKLVTRSVPYTNLPDADTVWPSACVEVFFRARVFWQIGILMDAHILANYYFSSSPSSGLASWPHRLLPVFSGHFFWRSVVYICHTCGTLQPVSDECWLGGA